MLKACHLKDIELLKQEHQDKRRHSEKKIDSLKHQLEKLEVLNKKQSNHNATLEQKIKELQISSPTSSFSTLTTEEFKQLAYRVNEQYHQSMTTIYTGLCEIHELYKSFEEQSDVLQDHRTQKTAAIKVLEDVNGWKTHIKDRPKDMLIMDKLRAKKIGVTIETWGSLCDVVGSIIQHFHEA